MNENEKEAIKVSQISIIVNIILSLIKLISGIVASSYAMISDAIHSASDVISSIIVIIGVKISGKESDKTHQYGHERFECIAALILATILIITGLGIGITGIKNIASRRIQKPRNTRCNCANCSRNINSCKRSNVLVHKKNSKKNKLKCSNGRRLAS